MKRNKRLSRWMTGGLICLGLGLCLAGCGRGEKNDEAPVSGKKVIQNTGSDTMVNVAQAWAEEYAKVDPSVSVEVSGGGSGTGIAALISGTVDIANCSRKMEPEEIEKARQNSHKEMKEYLVGYDALAIYVHKSNPLEEITIDQLAQIYGEKGTYTRWSDLGVKIPESSANEIIRISRQSNSGTYAYFREAILGKGMDFKLGSRDMHGSKDVVELVSHTPGAIGYSGMGYATAEVKKLRVAKKAGEQAFDSNAENTLNGSYPISRPLLMYSIGDPAPWVQKYLDWLHSDAGQAILTQCGYVALPKKP